MSFVICVMEQNRVTVCSEDRSGTGGGTGTFTMTGGGRIKNVHVTDEILYAVVGRISCADHMKAVVKGLRHLSFSGLVAVLPTIARQTIEREGNGARLTMTLAGWDADNQRMRGVIWNIWGDADDLTHIEVQPAQGAGAAQWVLGSGEDAQNLALNLMAQPGIKVPGCFSEVFAKLSASFPEIGQGLTVNSVTRPAEGSKIVLDVANSDDSTYAKTITSRVSSGKPLIDFSESIHLNKNIDNVADGTSFVRTSPDEKTGAGRGFTAIDSGNVVVAGSVDFSRSYTNKQLDNIGDGTTFRRVANVNADNTFHVSTSLNAQGSVLPNQGVLINFKTLPTLIAASWVSQSLLRADSSSLTVNSSSGTNLVVNGDGETGTVGAAAPSWTGNLITANDSVFAGAKSLKLSVSSTTLSGSQNVNLVGGQTYVLEGWVSEDALPSVAGQGAFIQLGIVSGITSYTIITKFGAYDAGNTTIPTIALPADGVARGFTFLQCYFTPTASGTVAVQLVLSSNGTVSCHFDNVQLYPFNGAIYTGLSASTAYHLYPYCQGSTGNLLFANGAPPPTLVSDTFTQSANLDGRIGFQPCTVTTPTTGTTTPSSGTGGGSGTCPECNEVVEIQRYSDAGELMFAGEIKAGEVRVGYESDDGLVKRGDFIKGHSFTKGMDVYRAVQKAMLVHCNGWVIVDGHRVTACEHIYKNGQWMPAWKAPGATHDRLSSWKVLIQVEADWEDEHNFYVGDLLIHNSIILPC